MELTEQLSAVAKSLRCNFTLQAHAISNERVFSETGLLPAIMRRADQLCNFCLGYGLGVKFQNENGAMLGVRVIFDNEVPNSLRIMCALDVIIELMQNAPSRNSTPLDELMYD